MKRYLSFNNNASWDMTRCNYQDELSNSSCNSQTLHIIRSIVDELYEINHHETSLRNESKEKRVRFTLKEGIESIKNSSEQEKSSIKYQPVLSDSTTVVCCLIKGRSKVDCSVSTNDLPSLQCECATQTIDNTIISDSNHSLMSLLTMSTDLHQSRSNTTCISSK
jgi:hypothetical protein